MLDILLFRDAVGGNSDLVRESERRRYRDPAVVDRVIDADIMWRKLQNTLEKLRKLVNDCSKTIANKKKNKEPDGDDIPIASDVLSLAHDGALAPADLPALTVPQLKYLSKFFAERVGTVEKEATAAEASRDAMLRSIGNIVHESIPVSLNEDNNHVVRTWGTCGTAKLNHVEVMEKLGVMDCGKTVTAMAGGRAYVLRGPLVQLQMALSMYAVNFLVQRGYMPFYPPFFMNRDVMAEVAQLSQFDEELYKVTGEGEDKYLIATSEMPIAAYHRNKWFTDLKEPIKYAGFSSCFRKEAGSHGKDTLGIFRVHQFDKIEQFVVCSPHDNTSWKMHDEMINTAEEFYKSLNLPYRVIDIVTGALNDAAARKYDLEAWFPASGKFRELVSASNCTDFQARRLNCRYGDNKKTTGSIHVKEYPHMLNATLCAITRTMCCIAENYQTPEGVTIPDVLQPYMGGIKFLSYADAPKYGPVTV